MNAFLLLVGSRPPFFPTVVKVVGPELRAARNFLGTPALQGKRTRIWLLSPSCTSQRGVATTVVR
eukprot:scaffold294658_cov33-Tisochrysis_lutea.AAC.6